MSPGKAYKLLTGHLIIGLSLPRKIDVIKPSIHISLSCLLWWLYSQAHFVWHDILLLGRKPIKRLHMTIAVDWEAKLQNRTKWFANFSDLSRAMRKPDFCLGENKGADQLRCNPIVFTVRRVQSHFFLNPKFQDSSQLLCLYHELGLCQTWS